MEFVETPSFWCPHVDRTTCTNFSTRTVEFRPSEGREILPFSFSFSFPFLFFFFSFSPFLFLRTLFFLCFFLSFLSFLLFFPLTQRILFGSYLISLSHSFLLILSFLLAISLLFLEHNLIIRQGRKFPSLFLQVICVVLDFLPFSFISYFPFYCIIPYMA